MYFLILKKGLSDAIFINQNNCLVYVYYGQYMGIYLG